MEKRLPVKTIITFAILVVAGVVLSVTAGNYVTGYDQMVIANTGSAIVGGSLAFFLVEMFRWDRERNKGE